MHTHQNGIAICCWRRYFWNFENTVRALLSNNEFFNLNQALSNEETPFDWETTLTSAYYDMIGYIKYALPISKDQEPTSNVHCDLVQIENSPASFSSCAVSQNFVYFKGRNPFKGESLLPIDFKPVQESVIYDIYNIEKLGLRHQKVFKAQLLLFFQAELNKLVRGAAFNVNFKEFKPRSQQENVGIFSEEPREGIGLPFLYWNAQETSQLLQNARTEISRLRPLLQSECNLLGVVHITDVTITGLFNTHVRPKRRIRKIRGSAGNSWMKRRKCGDWNWTKGDFAFRKRYMNETINTPSFITFLQEIRTKRSRIVDIHLLEVTEDILHDSNDVTMDVDETEDIIDMEEEMRQDNACLKVVEEVMKSYCQPNIDAELQTIVDLIDKFAQCSDPRNENFETSEITDNVERRPSAGPSGDPRPSETSYISENNVESRPSNRPRRARQRQRSQMHTTSDLEDEEMEPETNIISAACGRFIRVPRTYNNVSLPEIIGSNPIETRHTTTMLRRCGNCCYKCEESWSCHSQLYLINAASIEILPDSQISAYFQCMHCSKFSYTIAFVEIVRSPSTLPFLLILEPYGDEFLEIDPDEYQQFSMIVLRVESANWEFLERNRTARVGELQARCVILSILPEQASPFGNILVTTIEDTVEDEVEDEVEDD